MTMYTQDGDSWSEIRDLRVLAGGAFRLVQEAWVQNGGVWRKTYTYVPTRDTEVTASAPASATNGPVAITGSVTDALTDDLVTDVLTVELYSGATKLLTTSTSGGQYSFSWTPTAVGSQTLTVKVVGDSYWMPSQINTSAITVNSTTSVSVTSWPTYPIIGEVYTVTGSVSGQLTGTRTGNVALQANDGGTWTTLATAALSSGSFSLSWTPAAARKGANTLRVRYLGSGNFEASDSSSVSRTVYQPTPAVPSQTVASLTHNSMTLSITDQANVDRFVVACVETGNSVTTQSTGVAGATVTSNWTFSTNASYTFTLTAYSDNPTTPSRVGNTISITSGRPAQTDSGTAVFTFDAVETGSWRTVDQWDYLGTRIAQGYYTQSYGAYYGIARFDYSAMRSAVDNYGTARSNRYQNVSCTKFEIYAIRESGGAGAAVPISWSLSTADPRTSVGAPSLSAAGSSSPSGLSTGSSGWMTMSSGYNTWGTTLLNQVSGYKSVAMYHNGSSNYSIYSGGSNFKIRVTYSWDWTPVTYVAPTWSSS